MIKIRILTLCLLMYPFSNFTMEQEKFGYTDDELGYREWGGPALLIAGWPETISILNFDTERQVYFYQRLFEVLDRDDAKKAKFKLTIENRDQLRINLGPLKYFALRMLVNDKQVRYSFRSKGYIPSHDEKVLEDLGQIKFNNKRNVEYHATSKVQFVSLIEKKSNESQEERLTHIDVMHFDVAMGKYCYEPLLEEDAHGGGVLALSKNALEEIDLGPLCYFALRKAFSGCDKLPAHVKEGDEDKRRSWLRWENVCEREEQLGCIEQVMCMGLDGQMVEKDFHSKVCNQVYNINECEVHYSSQEGEEEEIQEALSEE